MYNLFLISLLISFTSVIFSLSIFAADHLQGFEAYHHTPGTPVMTMSFN